MKLTPTVNDSDATVKVGKGSSLTTVASGQASGAIALSVGSNAITVEVTAEDGTTTQTYTVTVTRQAPPQTPATVSLSASPNPVREGSSVTVTARLSKTLSNAVSIPVTVSTSGSNTAESGDVGTPPSITIASGQTTGTGSITTNQDSDADHETFTVSLGTLPSGVTAGSPSSVQVTISDDEAANTLSVRATPACGSTVSDMSVQVLFQLILAPAPSGEVATDWLIVNAGGTALSAGWTGAADIRTNGRSSTVTGNTIAQYRAAYPGFAGLKFRLRDDTSVETSCTWSFDDSGGGTTPTPTTPVTPTDTDTGGGGGGGGGGWRWRWRRRRWWRRRWRRRWRRWRRVAAAAARPPCPADAALSDLVATPRDEDGHPGKALSLSPAFTPSATAYTLDVPYETGTLAIAPATRDDDATARIAGQTLTAGQAHTAHLRPGETTVIEITVTAENDRTTRTYTPAHHPRRARHGPHAPGPGGHRQR